MSRTGSKESTRSDRIDGDIWTDWSPTITTDALGTLTESVGTVDSIEAIEERKVSIHVSQMPANPPPVVRRRSPFVNFVRSVSVPSVRRRTVSSGSVGDSAKQRTGSESPATTSDATVVMAARKTSSPASKDSVRDESVNCGGQVQRLVSSYGSLLRPPSAPDENGKQSVAERSRLAPLSNEHRSASASAEPLLADVRSRRADGPKSLIFGNRPAS